MMIDSETLKSRIGELCLNNDDLFSAKAYERIIGVIEAAPTIEAEPIRHGRWSECWHDDRLYSGICSECEKASVRPVGSDPLPICPKCGAKMQTEPPEEVQDDE